MQLFAIGVNHTTASVDVRERISFSMEQLSHALNDLTQRTCAQEAIILSTCNRTELYCSVDTEQHVDSRAMVEWFSHYHAVPTELLNPALYIHQEDAAIRHLMRVACGLDSMVLGEPQILGQLKDAFQTAQEAGTVGSLLGRLFQHSFAVAKQVRTDTAIGSSPVSVAFAAVRLAQQIFGDLSNRTALLIGAGETIELAARHLHENKLGRMVVANRTLERARQLALDLGGYAITLPEIEQHLAEADVVIASTASPTPILGVEAVKKAIKARKRQPMFMVDIAVPRDIEPAVGDLDDVYLYSVDDLNEVIQENMRSRAQAAQQAEEIIDTQTDHFSGWLRSLGAVETICHIRDQGNVTREQLLNKALRMLDNGKSPQEALEFLAHTLTNKLLHAPCNELRRAGYNGDYEFLEVARQLFQLPEKSQGK